MLGAVDESQTDRRRLRTQGLQRVGRITRWATAGGAAGVLVIGGVLAAGQAAAAQTAAQTSGSAGAAPTAPASPGTGTGATGSTSGSGSSSNTSGSGSSSKSLQPPATVPRTSHSSRSHVTSGSS